MMKYNSSADYTIIAICNLSSFLQEQFYKRLENTEQVLEWLQLTKYILNNYN